MTTSPSGEAEATSNTPDGSPEGSLGNEADVSSADNSQGEPQSPAPLPADVPAEGIPPQQDIDQASLETDTSTTKPASGDKDENPDAPGTSQERPEQSTTMLPQEPDTLQMFVGFQNPMWERVPETHSSTVSLSNSQEKTPQNVSEDHQEIAPPAPNADVPAAQPGPEEVPAAQPEEIQQSVGAADSPTADASGPDLQLDSREDLAEDSTVPESRPSPNSSESCAPPAAGSAPPSVALDRRVLDPSLYRADEENDYMRSMTSLLGGGEGSISSLADVLVWSDTAMGMGLALGLLASGQASPTDLLQDEGPNLRAASSVLDNTRSAFSSGMTSGTSSVLRSLNDLLHSVERRTTEGIHSAVRYLTSHLTPRWSRSGQDPD